MKTYKGSKNNKRPQLRKNVKKGTCNKIESEVMKQDSRSNDIWNRWKQKYEFKGDLK